MNNSNNKIPLSILHENHKHACIPTMNVHMKLSKWFQLISMFYSSCCVCQNELHGNSVFKDGQRVWRNSQDFSVALSYYSYAEGHFDDLYRVGQSRLISSPIHEVDVFMRDFIA